MTERKACVMTELRLQIKDETIYEGPAIAVPRAGEGIRHDGRVVRVEALTWDFGSDPARTSVVTVSLNVGAQAYTF
jgi:hypothetical protein